MLNLTLGCFSNDPTFNAPGYSKRNSHMSLRSNCLDRLPWAAECAYPNDVCASHFLGNASHGRKARFFTDIQPAVMDNAVYLEAYFQDNVAG